MLREVDKTDLELHLVLYCMFLHKSTRMPMCLMYHGLGLFFVDTICTKIEQSGHKHNC